VAVAGPIAVDGVTLAYEDAGAGPAIVFVHGWPMSSYSWCRVAGELSGSYRTICLDLMGFGKSDKPARESYTIERQAELVLGAIRQLGLQRIVLVGHSMGGGVCLAIMRELGADQDLVSGLVLIDSVCYPQRVNWMVRALSIPLLPEMLVARIPVCWAYPIIRPVAYYRHGEVSSAAIREYASLVHVEGGAHSFLASARQMAPSDLDSFTESYPQIGVPTQIIWGRQDRLIPCELGERLARAIPGAALDLVDQCGHCPQEEQPEATLAVLKRFLACE